MGMPSMQNGSARCKAGDCSCYKFRPVNSFTGRNCQIFHLFDRIVFGYPLDLPLLAEESVHAGQKIMGDLGAETGSRIRGPADRIPVGVSVKTSTATILKCRVVCIKTSGKT